MCALSEALLKPFTRTLTSMQINCRSVRGPPLAYVRHESCESTIVRVTVGHATHCRAVGEHRTAAKAAVPPADNGNSDFGRRSLNRSFAKSGIGGNLTPEPHFACRKSLL